MEPATPAMEEPPVTELTSPRGGAHDDGDSGDEGLWCAAVMSADPAGAGAGATGDALSNTAWDPRTVAEEVTAPATLIAEARLGRPIRAHQ